LAVKEPVAIALMWKVRVGSEGALEMVNGCHSCSAFGLE
jgi:hypothetical protein